MLKEKSVQLVQGLNELIKKYGSNDKVRTIVVEQFTNRNMKASMAINILNERLLLSTLDVSSNKDLILLFVFTKSMFTALTYKEADDKEPLGLIGEGLSITPEEYFTPMEIENLSEYKSERKKVENNEEVVFPKMIQIAPKFWVGSISAKYFAELDAGNEFIYNFKTQREPVVDVYGMKRISLSKTKVQEITEGLLSGEQFPDAIVINVLSDGSDQINFNEKNGDLVVVSGKKNIVDGMHRKVGNSNALAQNPDIDFNWIFIVTNFSEAKAQKQMVQINKQRPMKQEHIKSLDTTKLGNIVVDAMKDIDTSEFSTKIKESDAELKFDGMTKKSILALAIEETYSDRLTNRLQAKPIAKHIANVMDYVIGLNVEQFIIHPEETKKTSFINDKNMFMGYVALSEKLYGVKDWEDKLEDALGNIDFSITNPIWEDIKRENDMKKSSRNNLYKIFRNLIN